MFCSQLLAEVRGKTRTVMKGVPQARISTYTDNSATVDIAKSHGATGRTKHFERWTTYVRDLYQRAIINVLHVTTDKMPADIFTKALPYEPFTTFRAFLLGSSHKL